MDDRSRVRDSESALQQQWHTFDTALSPPDFTYIFNLEGRFTVYINRALLSLLEIHGPDR